MKHLHVDSFSGISGDMFLGALVDVGVSLADLKRGLKTMEVGGYRLESRKTLRGSIQATKVDVVVRDGFTAPLSLSRIRRILSKSGLPGQVKKRSREVFDRLAQAEGVAHGVRASRVQFHEVGVVDSLVDVVGSFLGCYFLGVESVTASPVNLGSGMIRSAHGTLPVPGPAVAELAKQVPIFSDGPSQELTTPTGMGILTVLTSEFGSIPAMTPDRTGYGAGTADPAGWPNVLRVFLGNVQGYSLESSESIVQVETNVDDLNPQVYETVMDRLFAAGALDVTLTPVIMKRSRPGIVLTALVGPDEAESVVRTMFQETSTLGVRFREVNRRVLPRKVETLRLPHGTVRIKTAQAGPGLTKMTPEYQDCRRIADKTGKPVREVMEQAIQAYSKGRGRRSSS